MKTTPEPLEETIKRRHIAHKQAKEELRFGPDSRQGLISSQKRIYPKLEVGAAKDPAEREADLAAEQVLRGGKVGTPHSGAPAQLGPQMLAMSGESKGGMNTPASVESSIQSKRGQGGSLPKPIQQKLSHTFGTDFSGVKVHTDSTSHDMNAQLRAKAFTQGSDMFFGKGQYAPGTAEGDRLIAHEAAHVVQQHPDRIQRKPMDKAPSTEGPTFVFLTGASRLKNALDNLTVYFPSLMAAFKQFSGTITLTEGELEGNGTGLAISEITPVGDLDDYYFQSFQDDEGYAAGGGYLPRPSIPSPSSLDFVMESSLITIDVKQIELVAASEYKASITKNLSEKEEFEKIYFATLAHELLGHTLFVVQNPMVSYAFLQLSKSGKLKPGDGPGHEAHNPSGVMANWIGTDAEKLYWKIRQDPQFKRILPDIH
jgi:Domain of unknown function (DUF4157)